MAPGTIAHQVTRLRKALVNTGISGRLREGNVGGGRSPFARYKPDTELGRVGRFERARGVPAGHPVVLGRAGAAGTVGGSKGRLPGEGSSGCRGACQRVPAVPATRGALLLTLEVHRSAARP
jgi:hypothetical protein